MFCFESFKYAFSWYPFWQQKNNFRAPTTFYVWLRRQCEHYLGQTPAPVCDSSSSTFCLTPDSWGNRGSHNIHNYSWLHLKQLQTLNLHHQHLFSISNTESLEEKKWSRLTISYSLVLINCRWGSYDEVVPCGSITLQSKTVWGRYSSVVYRK